MSKITCSSTAMALFSGIGERAFQGPLRERKTHTLGARSLQQTMTDKIKLYKCTETRN